MDTKELLSHTQDLIGIAQSCAITVSFLYAVYKAMPAFKQWQSHKERMAEIAAADAEKERQADAVESDKRRMHDRERDAVDVKVRHDMAGVFTNALAQFALSNKEELQVIMAGHREDIKSIVFGHKEAMAVVAVGICRYTHVK